MSRIERVHLQFCKRLLGVKKTTQNDFIYGELGRTSCITKRYILIIKYCFKILLSEDVKYIKLVYNMMLEDLELNPKRQIGLLFYVIYYFLWVLMKSGFNRE